MEAQTTRNATMTFNAAVPRFSSKRAPTRSRSQLPAKSRTFLPVKWQPVQRLRQKFSPKFFLAMAVSVVSSISFLWVLFLVIMAG